jgi:hypothetical protein
MKRIYFLLALLFLAGYAISQPLPPPAPVPIDGGLSLLLAAGGALGYKVYKNRQEKKD